MTQPAASAALPAGNKLVSVSRTPMIAPSVLAADFARLAEAAADPVKIAHDIRAAGARAGLSLKPKTPFEPYVELLRHYDTLLIMSVEPGFGGQEFMSEVLDKVRTARRMADSGELRVLVEIDGGVNDD